MAVCQFPPDIGGAQFIYSYTNQDGLAGRVSPIITMNLTTTSGSILTSANSSIESVGPFLPLADGDTGIRSIESLTMLTQEVGVFTLVLVKPIATHVVLERLSPVELNYINMSPSMPRVQDGACLNYIMYASGSTSGTTAMGLNTFQWG